jgi:hypothetical protein
MIQSGYRKNKKNVVAQLVKKVKTLRLVNASDCALVSSITDAIFSEWIRVRGGYKKVVRTDKKFIEKLYVKFEAEEEILISLIFMMNEKLLAAFSKV